VLAAIKAMNLNVIDLTLSDKAQYHGLNLILHPLDEHPSALANQIMGPMVAKSIAEVFEPPLPK
jgi:hypothetical protein